MAGLIAIWVALLGLAAFTGHFLAVLLVTGGVAVLTIVAWIFGYFYSDDWG